MMSRSILERARPTTWQLLRGLLVLGLALAPLSGAVAQEAAPPAEEAVLRTDYEELSDLLGLGHFDELDARLGEALQVRPKAADSRVASWAMNAEAEWVQVNPRGYYLRADFTWQVLAG